MKRSKENLQLINLSDTLSGFEKFYINATENQDQPIRAARIWAEPQLFLVPLCVPQDKREDRFRSVEVSETVVVNGQTKRKIFRVNPDPRYGLPGLFELEVMLMIYQLASEYFVENGMVPEQFDIGSLSGFLKKMKRPTDGRYIGMLKEALKRLAATNCVSEGFFYSKTKDLYVIESFQFISAAHIAGEEDHNGGWFEKTTVKLHPLIRDNLNAKFRTLINVDYIRELKTDVAKPLCLHLSYRFYVASQSGLSYWDADYAWLASRIGLRVQTELRRAKQQLKPALNELKNTGFIIDWMWLDNGKLRFIVGKAYAGEHSTRVTRRNYRHVKYASSRSVDVSHAVEKRHQHQEPPDPLVPLCALYAVTGWTEMVQKKAKDVGLTETDLKRELAARPIQTT